MNFSFRGKLTLALIGTAFFTIAVVGFAARAFEANRFGDVVIERAFAGFAADAVAYYEAHGSWEAAREAESYFEFTARRNRLRGPAVFRGAAPPPGMDPAMGPGPDRDSGRPVGPGPGEPPPGELDPVWVITNLDGVVEVAMAGFDVGEAVPRGNLAAAVPLVSGDLPIGLGVAVRRPVLTAIEEEIFEATEQAWLLALIVTALIALPMALLLSHMLARPLRELDRAMSAMQAGQLRQSVGVTSDDEIGRLAARFNAMSAQLATSYDELEASRHALSTRAIELAELSRRDALTGLYNRRAFDQLAGSMVERAHRYEHPVAFAMIDLDHFKAINDDFSHSTGDRVLVRAAELLVASLRESDLVARYGGEEFVVAFPETDRNGSLVVAERLRRNFEDDAWDTLAPGLSVTVSLGVVEIEKGETVLAALDRADEQLYSAKKAGRNRVEAS
jgi:diguanylate cyclase (GGDEF)-like protein